jgi:hypothetical protein
MAKEFDRETFGVSQLTNDSGRWRETWILIGYLVFVSIGIATVLLPELRDEPETASPAKSPPATASAEKRRSAD